jgi:hypothetical protein
MSRFFAPFVSSSGSYWVSAKSAVGYLGGRQQVIRMNEGYDEQQQQQL